MNFSNSMLPAALTAALLPSLSAQTTIQVGGPGGLPDIRAALAVAQPGDELLVQPGSYAHFTLDVGVTIRAAIPGTVDVFLDPSVIAPTCTGICLLAEHVRIAPPSGQSAHLEGIDFLGPVTQVNGVMMSNRVSLAGRVSMRDCTISAGFSTALTIESGSNVHMQSCAVLGSYPFQNTANLFVVVATVVSSRLSAVDCTFAKTDNLALAFGAVRLDNSTLHGSGLTIRRTGGQAFFHALDLTNSTAWISDSNLLGSSGACAVVGSGGQLFADRSTISGPASCIVGQVDGARVGVSELTPPTANAPYSITYRTTPNSAVGVFVAGGLEVSGLPQLPQPTWLPLASAFPAAVLLADANGLATVTWQLPTLPGSPRPELWVQGISGILPFQISPVVGGVVR